MLTAYLSTFIVGSSLLALSIFAGGEMDSDADFDADADFDTDADLDADGEGHGMELELHGMDAWLPIGSLRFWTFFAAFFGLVGTALTALGTMAATLTLVPSIGVGYVSGITATRLLKKLTKQSVGKVLGAGDMIGSTGTIVLPVGPGLEGKIRLQMGGRTLEHNAMSDESINAGASAIVISIHEDGGVWVSPAPLLEA
jgi:membrane protein implicated in regulation of membrane protease activity